VLGVRLGQLLADAKWRFEQGDRVRRSIHRTATNTEGTKTAEGAEITTYSPGRSSVATSTKRTRATSLRWST
jgi:hypothetical protein